MDELSTLIYIAGSLGAMLLLSCLALTGLAALGAPAKNKASIPQNRGGTVSASR